MLSVATAQLDRRNAITTSHGLERQPSRPSADPRDLVFDLVASLCRRDTAMDHPFAILGRCAANKVSDHDAESTLIAENDAPYSQYQRQGILPRY